MLNQTPLITIGVSCYNAIGTIRAAIESALKQDWPNFEILIIDDHSSDGSKELVERLAVQDSKIRVIHHAQNQGVGASRKSLIEHAQGEFVAFFDDDDTSLPNRLRAQYERIVTYENAVGTDLVACYTARQQILPDGQRKYVPTLGMDVTPGPNPDRVAELILLGRPTAQGNGACATCSLMARKEVFVRAGSFDPSLRRGEDTDFNIRLALIRGHFAGLAKPLVVQAVTPGADKQLGEERKNQLRRIELHRDYLTKIGWYSFVFTWVHFKFDVQEGEWLKACSRALLLLVGHPMKLATRLWWLLLTSWRNKRTLAKIDQ